MPKDANGLPEINFDTTDEANFVEETHVILSVEAQKEMWDRIKAKLRVQLGEDVYSSWFKGLALESLEKNTIFLSVPTLSFASGSKPTMASVSFCFCKRNKLT